MNGIVRSLLFVTAIGLLAVVLICASDDSEAEQVEVVFGDGIAVTYQDRSGGTPPYPQYMIYDSPSLIDDSYYITAAPMEMEYGNIFLNGVDVGPGNQFFRISDYPDGIHFEVFRSDYSVVFGRNGGEGETQTSIINLENGDNFTIPDVLYTRLGYRSVQWNTREDGTGEVISPGNYTMDLDFIRNHYSLSNNDLVLYPGWVAVNYSINYNLNNGNATNITSYNINTAKFTLNNPSRNGYSFTGWSGTDISGTSMNVTIESGSVGNRSYTANWSIITYDISYNLDGGTANGNPTNYTVATNTFTLNNPTRLGYNFIGWSGTGISGTSSSVSISKGSIGNRSYTANWQIIEYIVSCDLEGGSVSGNVTKYTVEDTFALNNPTRAGYTFIGWSGTDISGKSMSVSVPKGSIGNRSYAANWTANQNVVVFNANGGSGSMANQQIQTDATASLNANTFTKTGYHFIGWATSANGAVMYSDCSYYKMGTNASYTLYAVWEQNTNQIVFNANSGSGSMENQDGLTNSTVTLNQCTFTAPTGYYFAGWSEEPNGSADYLDCASFPVGTNSVYTLYAIWNKMPATSSDYFTFNLIEGDTYEITSVSDNIPSNVIIPETYNGKAVTRIGTDAFLNNLSVTSVIIFDNITSIGGSAFNGCRNLTNITIPDSVKSIEHYAFYYCTSLTSIVLPDGIDCIAARTFEGCDHLTSIFIPDGITSIELGAFCNCIRLREIIIPDGVISIGDSAFAYCHVLTDIVIPDSVSIIGNKAFEGCYILTNVFYKGTSIQWATIEIKQVNTYLTNATIYYYSETDPVESGNYWHYVDGEPTKQEEILYQRVNADGIPDTNGDYLLFGEYPQSEVTDSGLKTALNTLAGTLPTNGNNNGWTSYEYYINGSNSTDFMWYKDLSYNGEKYRGVYFTKYRSRTTIGSNSDTYQDDNGYSPNSIYWFKWEPVKWQIITTQDGQALLLSELVIDSQNFYLNYNQRTINGNTVYANNYEYSDIRNWLNEEFYSSAFNNEQQGIIQITLIDNSAKTTNPNDNSMYWDNGTNNYSCGNTNDAIFLFSVSDLTNETYGYSNNVEIKDDFRIKQASDYAKSQGCGEWENGASNWWTRSSVYSSSHYIRACAADGTVGEWMYNGVYDTQNGIVPALWIKL